MAYKLNMQQKKDIEKFAKFFAYKTAQIIVQSRLGEKANTPCNPDLTSSDWFNLAVPDIQEVYNESKKVLSGDPLTTNNPLCIEISVRTIDGDHMVIESWCLSVLDHKCDPGNRITHTVYNHMAILLKSLVTVTRVTPAYRLSRRQGPDAFVMCYRIYSHEPQLNTLGESYKQVRIGQVCTPLGTLQLSVSYRTNMEMSPTSKGKENIIMLKSDHFEVNLSPRHNNKNKINEEKISLSTPLRIGPFAGQIPDYKPQLIFSEAPFSNLLPQKKSPPPPLKEPEEEFNKSDEENEDKNGNTPINESGASDLTMVSTNDDFIMVELKTPFANPNPKTELGQFYRECQSAPPLKTFTEVPTIAEQVQNLSEQLESYESDMQDYENVLQSICESPNNN